VRAEKATTRGRHDRPYAQGVVIHGVPVRYKAGMMGRWIQEDNTGIKVMGVGGYCQRIGDEGKKPPRWSYTRNRRKR